MNYSVTNGGDTMRCAQCGQDMEKTTGIHRYDESGLKNVILMNVPMYKCVSCGETELEIPAMEELHCLIGLFVLYQPNRLGSAEVRYIRKHMGYSQDELASYIGVTRGTITRWESGRAIRVDQDKALRQLYVRKKCEELEHIGIDSKRLLEVVLERLPMKSKQQFRIRTEDWTNKEEGNTCSSA